MKNKIAKEAVLLVVDDDAMVRETVVDLLKPHFARVLEAGSGAEALGILKRHAVNVMLVDQRMPGMTGVELMRKVKEFNPLMPFLMLTGHSEDVEIQEALAEGVFDVMEKPFNNRILINRIINSMLLPKMVRVLWSSMVEYLPAKDLIELEKAPLERQLDVLYSYSGLLHARQLKKRGA